VSITRTWLQTLMWLLIATVMSSIFHYVDNVMYFHEYPEPDWLDSNEVDRFWFYMTPLAYLGYHQLKRHRYHSGVLFTVLYALCNLLTLGHYWFAPIHEISLKINTFILIEAFFGFILLMYVLVPYCQLFKNRTLKDKT